MGPVSGFGGAVGVERERLVSSADVGEVGWLGERCLGRAQDHVRLGIRRRSRCSSVVVYSITLARASSWRIITAGMPRPAWRILSNAALDQSLVADGRAMTRT